MNMSMSATISIGPSTGMPKKRNQRAPQAATPTASTVSSGNESTPELGTSLVLDLAAALVEREPRADEIAPSEALRCRYSSKKCVRVRATKHKGQLHMLCSFHRAKAIVNQRRLELRKRARGDLNKRRNARRSAASQSRIQTSDGPGDCNNRHRESDRNSKTHPHVMLPTITVPNASMILQKPATKVTMAMLDVSSPSPRDFFELEPFRTPATLHAEDLEALMGFVDVDVKHVESFLWDFEI